MGNFLGVSALVLKGIDEAVEVAEAIACREELSLPSDLGLQSNEILASDYANAVRSIQELGGTDYICSATKRCGGGSDDDAAALSPVAAPASKRSLMSSLMDATALLRSPSFKEDSYVAAALPSSELSALADLKVLLATHPDPISIWGVPLNPHSPPAVADDAAPAPVDERADVVLLKFLRARDFRVRDAHAMLLRCAAWRAEFGGNAVLDGHLGFKKRKF
ncbi:unnamed protein product [Miscanthus lutarioriparius]|uniref:CRAL/TRIO N-terminal domain-containing protein n=1 Tax=Miscanthus lutarioriparius TaxID=422564 RepID=A0A811RGQ7_9POAL|nr:unnamed protein product [Miscanthus lutarioriparius]